MKIFSMKNRVLVFTFVLMSGLSLLQAGGAGADADVYLAPRLLAHNLYVANGNGRESGFQLNIRYFGSSLADPIFLIPEEDNLAQCRVKETKLIDSQQIHLRPEPSEPYYWQTYVITIETAVEADSGGCLVLAQDPFSRRTVALISYRYLIEDEQ